MKRKVLLKTGRRGDAVKVVVDEKLDRIVVYYRTINGPVAKKNFDTSKAGKSEAIAWAETYHTERKRIAEQKVAPKRITLAQLWDAYTSSPAFLSQLREKTQRNYAQRFKGWLTFLGVDHCPNDTTLLDVDQYFTRGQKAGKALNQLHQVVNVARVVYRWGQSRKLVQTNELSLFRFQQPKDVALNEPAEYTNEEFARLLEHASPQHGGTWRINVMILLGGNQGMRANALLKLRWSDLDEDNGCIVWPAAYQKNGKEFTQPLTFDSLAAIETAFYWRERSGYDGPWVFFAGGGNKKLGAVVVGSERSYRKARTPGQDTPYTYGGAWTALQKLEKAAGIEHKPYRGFHGLRKMAAGNVADVTQDARLGMEWIGDTDPKMMRRYLKTRSSRLDRAATAAQGKNE